MTWKISGPQNSDTGEKIFCLIEDVIQVEKQTLPFHQLEEDSAIEGKVSLTAGGLLEVKDSDQVFVFRQSDCRRLELGRGTYSLEKR